MIVAVVAVVTAVAVTVTIPRADLKALPAGGEQTLEFLRHENVIADRKGQSQAESDYAEISVLLTAHLMTSKGLASLYRALATLPGGEVTDHLVKDAVGHRVIALTG